MEVRAKSVPNGGAGLKKILFFVFTVIEKRKSQRNHWVYGVETFFFSQWDFCGRGIGGAASLFSAVLQSQFVTMLFEVRQAITVTWLANKKKRSTLEVDRFASVPCISVAAPEHGSQMTLSRMNLNNV
jgi:hypothetical protein